MFYPFFEEISEPNEWPDEPDPKEYQGKMYTYTEANTEMRQMERGVRATKREIEAQTAIGGDTTILKSKLRGQTAKYHEFCREMEIRPKTNRLSVVKGSSDLTKTRSFEKYAMKSRENAISASNIISAQTKYRTIIEKDIIKKGIALDKPIFDSGNLGNAYRKWNIQKEKGYYDVVGHGSPNIMQFF